MRSKNDFYETPKSYVDALNYSITFDGSIFEPCVGDGSLLNYLNRDNISNAWTNDLDPHRMAQFHFNAAWEPAWPQEIRADWIITNPPFSDIEPIIEISWDKCRRGIAFLCRISFLEPINSRLKLLQSLHIKDLIFLPRHSFTGKGNDFVTCCWLIAEKDNSIDDCSITFVGRK